MIKSIILFIAIIYNVVMFYFEGGFNHTLSRRIFYLYVCSLFFLSYFGLIEIKFLSKAIGVIYDGLGGVESKIGSLNNELKEKMRTRFSSGKKQRDSREYDKKNIDFGEEEEENISRMSGKKV